MSPSRHPVLSVVYSSTAASPFTDAELAALLTVSRHNNARAVLHRHAHHAAGPLSAGTRRSRAPGRGTHDKDLGDSGHHDVRILLKETIEQRQFPEWTMSFKQLSNADEETVPGYRTAFDDLADENDDVNGTTAAVRELIRWFQARPTPTM